MIFLFAPVEIYV